MPRPFVIWKEHKQEKKIWKPYAVGCTSCGWSGKVYQLVKGYGCPNCGAWTWIITLFVVIEKDKSEVIDTKIIGVVKDVPKVYRVDISAIENELKKIPVNSSLEIECVDAKEARSANSALKHKGYTVVKRKMKLYVLKAPLKA